MNRLLRKMRKAGGYDRVRIVILDTGIDCTHPYWNGIKNYMNFVLDGNQRGIDETGHGTTGVHLILKILPEADIFVARVFKEENADDNTPCLMAKVCTQRRGGSETYKMS